MKRQCSVLKIRIADVPREIVELYKKQIAERDPMDAGFEYEMCCSGFECGCLGLPIEPCLCSDECYMTFIKTPKQRITKELLKNVRKKHGL